MQKSSNYIFVFCLLVFSSSLFAQRLRTDIEELKRINITDHSGEYLPLDVELIDQDGNTVLLKDYFQSGKPVILSFAYYECKMLCTQVLSAMASSINKFDWDSENKYSIVTISIDPRDKPESAALKKSRYVSGLDDNSLMYNWNFFTASQATIDTLTKAIGFEYFYVEEIDEYAHPAAIFVLSPDGKISRYLYGLNFEPKDLKFSLIEASDGKVGNPMEQLLLYCYHYDASSNTYTPLASNIMRLGGVITLILLGLFLAVYWYRERKAQYGLSKQ